MNIKAKVTKSLLLTAVGLMGVAGCGPTQDGTESDAAVKAAVDIPALKAAAMSNIANSPCVAHVGNGCVVDMTIDSTMQRIVSETLCRAADTNDTGVGWAILVSVKEGAILALADCGGDSNTPRPFALTRQFAPGHLLSTLTVAAALDAGIVKPSTELSTDPLEAVFCEYNLPADVGRSAESTLTVSNALACSANVVLSKLGILVGREKEHDVLHKFGIGGKSGIGFPGESAGRLLPPENWSKVHRVRIPIGQGVECTAMQIARAYATLANHGTLVEPYVVKRIVNAIGGTLYAHTASSNRVQAVSRGAADNTCAILEGAVGATGRRAAVKGVRVGGKTATIQRMKPDSLEFETDKYISSFAGFFPADDPKYVLVVCYETKRIAGTPYIHLGGGRPAMAFAEIACKISHFAANSN